MCCHWQQLEVVRPAPLADLITEYDAAGIMAVMGPTSLPAQRRRSPNDATGIPAVMGPTSLSGATAPIAERYH